MVKWEIPYQTLPNKRRTTIIITRKWVVTAILAVSLILTLTGCSNVDKDQLYGTWEATIAVPSDYETAIIAQEPGDFEVSSSRMLMTLSLMRDESFWFTSDMRINLRRYTNLVQGGFWLDDVGRSVSTSGTWRYFADDLDLNVKNPSSGVTLGWKVVSASSDGNQLTLADEIYGEMIFSRVR